MRKRKRVQQAAPPKPTRKGVIHCTEEVRGKCVRSIYVSGVDEFNVVNVDFTDSTSLTVQIIPAAKLKVDYNDWTTGNLKPLKEWPLLITR